MRNPSLHPEGFRETGKLTFATLQDSFNKVKHRNVLLPHVPKLYVLTDFILLLITADLGKYGKGQRGSLKLALLQGNILLSRSVYSVSNARQIFIVLHPSKSVRM